MDGPARVPSKAVWGGLLVISCVVLVNYAAALRIGFYTDDYTYLEYAGRLAVPQYLVDALDPRAPFMTYRPLLRLLFLIEYLIFRFEAGYYHLVQLLFHLGNCFLCFGIVWRLSNRWRLAWVTALGYAGLSTYSWAVLWISVHDPSATFFYLLSLWFWISYLRVRSKSHYLGTMVCLILALLGKETSVTAPLALFLIDRWIIRDTAGLKNLAKRYSGIAIVLFMYGVLEYIYQSAGIFVIEGKYSIGAHVIPNALYYLALLFSPFGVPLPPILVGMLLVIYVAIVFLRRSVALAFIAVMVVLNVLPILPIPWTTQGRYLYLALLGQACVVAIFFEAIAKTRWRWSALLATILITWIVVANGLGIAQEVEFLSEIARRARVPFRDIMRQNPTFPPNTLIYLIEPPGSIPDIQGMFFQRYGERVLIKGTFEDGMSYAGGKLRQQSVRLRDYALSQVYYFQTDNHPRQVHVDQDVSTQISPALPILFNVAIQLEGYEVTTTLLPRGGSLVLILFWRCTGNLERDYTVFVHMVDQSGNLVTSTDGMPRDSKEHTSAWQIGRLTADAHILEIPADLLTGEYHLEVGLYYAPTMERLHLVDAAGNPITDHISIASFRVRETVSE